MRPGVLLLVLLLPLTSAHVWVRIQFQACVKVSSDMGLVGSFSHVLRFPQSSRSSKLRYSYFRFFVWTFIQIRGKGHDTSNLTPEKCLVHSLSHFNSHAVGYVKKTQIQRRSRPFTQLVLSKTFINILQNMCMNWLYNYTHSRCHDLVETLFIEKHLSVYEF